MNNDELLSFLFDDPSDALVEQMAAWLGSSRRFAGFAADYRDKIRKKLRLAKEPDSLLDLCLELESAYRLLQETTLGVVYEPLPIGQVRGPDFAVSYTSSTQFMLEVTRPRPPREAATADWLADAVCGKLRQLPPQHACVLLLGAPATLFTQTGLRDAMLRLQQRAELGDEAVIARHRFRDRADFFRHYRRLSELLLRSPDGLVAWTNPQARAPLPPRVRTAVRRALGSLP